MIANNLIEIYTLIFAWNMYGAIWDVMVQSGLALVPFIVVIVMALGAYREDEGVGSIVKNLEGSLISMLLVMTLCVFPIDRPVGLASISYNINLPDCNLQNDPNENLEGEGDDTGEDYDDTFGAAVAGSTIEQPVAWYGVNYLANAFTHTAIKSMGCVNNYEFMLLRVGQVQIQDPVVRERVKDFGEVCYKKARDRFELNPVPLPNDVDPLNDVDWIGSRTFLSTADEYYDHESAYMANMEKFDFTRNTVDRPQDAGAESGAHPYCSEVWLGEANGNAEGLRQIILDSIPEDEVGDIVEDWMEWGSLGFSVGELDDESKEDMIIKLVLQADAMNLESMTDIGLENDFNSDRGFWEGVKEKVLGFLGTTVSVPQLIEAHTIKVFAKIAGPMILAIVQMIVVMAAPFVMLLTGYRFTSFFALALTYFAFEFINVMWATAFWFDNHIFDLYMSNSDLLDKATNTMLAMFISAGMIIMMPLIWLSVIAYAGAGMVRGMSAAGGGMGTSPAGRGVGGAVGSAGAYVGKQGMRRFASKGSKGKK
jgi:hypothetical protein